jgi:o-succinylbenzoate---CoA ligase
MDVITRAAELFGNSPMLKMAGRNISFIECNREAQEIAQSLYHKGVCAGDIVAIVAPNSGEMVLLLLGLLKAGMIAAPLNYRFPEERLRKTLEKLCPRLIATGGKEGLTGFSTVTIASILDHPHNSETLDPLPDFGTVEGMHRPVTIIHSSGSSGEAKAALHSFANHWYNALGSNANIHFGKLDCWLLSLPLYHIGGYSLLFRSLISGGALAIGEQDESLVQSLQNFPLTHLSLVPTQLYRLLDNQKSTPLLRKLKAVLLGGSAAPKSLIEEALRQHTPLYLSYGSTEMASQIATTPAPIATIQQSSGQLLPYRELSVAKDGELLVKGLCLFQGYLQGGLIQPRTDQEGWFHTADIGSFSEKGEVTVLGRKDNMFISGGENIHPEEIEKALMMIDGVLEAVVVPVSDDEYGQRPVAFIQSIEEEKPDEQAIIEAMQTMVGKLKTPIRYFPVRQWITLPGSQKSDRAWYQKEASAPSGSSLEP